MEISLHQRIAGADRARLAKALVKGYEGGASIRELASQHATSIGRIRRLLVESGVQFRPRGGRRRDG